MQNDVDHLGVVIGDPSRARLVALGTSTVFSDASLLRTWWNTDAAHLDNGLQAHLYTRPADVFVVQVPPAAVEPRRRLAVALDANRRIWSRLGGADLVSSDGKIVLAIGSDVEVPVLENDGPSTMTWFRGSMLDAVAALGAVHEVSVLAFVCDEPLLARLGIDASDDTDLAHRARVVSELMDKGAAMSLLQRNAVPSAWSQTFEANDDAEHLDRALTVGMRCVFKPTGGAAGIGVFTDDRKGADTHTLMNHVRRLREEGRLPQRFQVQEFLSGPVIGASLLLDGLGGCRVLEIHHQLIDQSARFVGARWARPVHAELEGDVASIGRSLSTSLGVPLLVGLDMVDGRVIEVNPRLTASAPIAHLLRNAEGLEMSLGGHPVERIDIDTQVPIPWKAIMTGRAETAAEHAHSKYGTLVLPQGLNPFGNTRVAFVNDDHDRSARSAFLRRVT